MADAFTTRQRFDFLDQVQDDPGTSAGSFRLAYVVASYVNHETGDAWPSQERLAREVGVTSRTIRDLIDKLASGGHIVVTGARGRGHSNRYRPVIKNRNQTSGQSAENRNCTSAQEAENRNSASGFNGHANRKSHATKPEIWRTKTGSQLPTTFSEDLSEEITEDRYLNSLTSKLKAKQPSGKLPQGSNGKPLQPDLEAEFEEIWKLYPRKKSKGAALKAFKSARKKVDCQTIKAGVLRYAAERASQDPTYTRYPATWFNSCGWTDEPDPAHVQGNALTRAFEEINAGLDRGRSFEDIASGQTTDPFTIDHDAEELP